VVGLVGDAAPVGWPPEGVQAPALLSVGATSSLKVWAVSTVQSFGTKKGIVGAVPQVVRSRNPAGLGGGGDSSHDPPSGALQLHAVQARGSVTASP
jgi:hypothetical protein